MQVFSYGRKILQCSSIAFLRPKENQREKTYIHCGGVENLRKLAVFACDEIWVFGELYTLAGDIFDWKTCTQLICTISLTDYANN